MEDIVRPHSCKRICPAPTNNNKLAMHTDSHVVSKLKPKIRIIHIFSPEIIKTDVANFRELVQRLTGKPCEDDHESKGISKKKARNCSRKKFMKTSCSCGTSKNSLQLQEESPASSLVKREKLCHLEGENEMIGESENNSSGGFLDGFAADLNAFVCDFATLGAPDHRHPPPSCMDVFGDIQYLSH